jgi:hypothetical protein
LPAFPSPPNDPAVNVVDVLVQFKEELRTKKRRKKKGGNKTLERCVARLSGCNSLENQVQKMFYFFFFFLLLKENRDHQTS